MASEKKLIEELSESINLEWKHWSKDIAKKEALSHKRLIRWQKLWNTPYSKLPEEMKESDRVWARKVIEVLKKNGIVLDE